MIVPGALNATRDFTDELDTFIRDLRRPWTTVRCGGCDAAMEIRRGDRALCFRCQTSSRAAAAAPARPVDEKPSE
ncbi:MAG: hypothetical protein KGK34_07300 [Chloroflexota bacterium]|nr:hypothetical protein [Chloroflexota bacterium]